MSDRTTYLRVLTQHVERIVRKHLGHIEHRMARYPQDREFHEHITLESDRIEVEIEITVRTPPEHQA